ncbi:hypothetical protein [Halobacteriovorax sp.]|uniref:hypothetical protein n=1 Tax=Halobacteriovorax sp. TaxID=2020862 RepID=UPI003AF27804
MKKLIATILCVSVMSTSSMAFFGKEKGISGRYKGKERISLNYNGIRLLGDCNGDSRFGFNAASLAAAGLATLLSPAASVATFALMQGWKQAACVDKSVGRTNIFKVKLEAKVVETNSERITLMISSKDKKKCAGFSIKLIGEPDGFGAYDLYKNKDSYLKNEVFGTATYADKELDIAVTEALELYTKGRNGHNCLWDLRHGLNISLKK